VFRRPIRSAFLVLFFAAVVVAIGLLIAQDQQTRQIRSAYGAGHPLNPGYVAALAGAHLTVGNHYQVLTNGDEVFSAMLGAIDAARRRINFETYIYDTGRVADQFTDAFERAARRGVRLTIIVDAVGGASMEQSHVDRIRQAGGRVIRFNAPRWYSLEDVNYRTHRKILVVDGEVGFTGGVGIADHWIGDAEGEDQWRDTHVLMRGPIVHLLEAAFYEDLIEADGVVTPELDVKPPAVDEEGPSLLVRSSPTGGANDLKRVYLLIIASARRSLDIATPYFVTDESTMWALEDAIGRGVRIRLLVEGDITDAMPVKYASRRIYDRLMSLGVEIYEYQPTMMHAKVLIADRILSMFGSANFDNRSLELNDELNAAVWSREVAERFEKDFARDLQSSQRLDLAAWRNRPWLDKARERFWSLFGEVF
jgi:cardiolipin synthase